MQQGAMRKLSLEKHKIFSSGSQVHGQARSVHGFAHDELAELQ